MAISFNSDINAVAAKLNTQNASSAKANDLTNSIKGLSKDSSDEELLNACKSFEAYLAEQVMTRVKDAMVPKDEDKENPYLEMFGDRLYREYANTITEKGELGIAQQLYEAMKRNYGGTTDT